MFLELNKNLKKRWSESILWQMYRGGRWISTSPLWSRIDSHYKWTSTNEYREDEDTEKQDSTPCVIVLIRRKKTLIGTWSKHFFNPCNENEHRTRIKKRRGNSARSARCHAPGESNTSLSNSSPLWHRGTDWCRGAVAWPFSYKLASKQQVIRPSRGGGRPHDLLKGTTHERTHRIEMTGAWVRDSWSCSPSINALWQRSTR